MVREFNPPPPPPPELFRFFFEVKEEVERKGKKLKRDLGGGKGLPDNIFLRVERFLGEWGVRNFRGEGG